MYERILVAVGDDPHTDAPLTYAITLATQLDAELCLLRGLALPLSPCVPDMAVCSARAVEHIMQEHERVLAWAMEAAAEAGVASTATMRWGAVPDILRQTAVEAACDLIVIGAPTSPGRQHPYSSALAWPVFRKTLRPVLVVSHPPPGPSDASLWSRMLVVHDGSASANGVLTHALTLAREALLDICVLRLATAYASPVADPLTVTHFGEELTPMLSTQTAIAGVDYEIILARDAQVHTVAEAAREYECDVIMLGTRPHSPWRRFQHRRFAKALMRATDLPVLSIPSAL